MVAQLRGECLNGEIFYSLKEAVPMLQRSANSREERK